MNTVLSALTSVRNHMDSFVIAAKTRMRDIATRKHSGIDGIIVVVGLAIIALVIILIFKDQLKDFVVDLTKNMQDKAQEVLDSAGKTTP